MVKNIPKEDLKKPTVSASKKVKQSSHSKELKKLKEKLAESEQLLFEYNEKYLRMAADFDNYRKRIQKEMGEIIKYAGERVLRNILPVLDDFERALVNHEGDKDSEQTLQQGLEMIYKKFTKTIYDMDVKPIESLNQPFDPDLHHAVMAKEVEGVESEMVIEEFERGYLFKDHVLRHTKVVVSK